MQNNKYLVRLRSHAIQEVQAAKVEIYGEHLAFVTPEGKLAALFSLSVVESWSEMSLRLIPLKPAYTPWLKIAHDSWDTLRCLYLPGQHRLAVCESCTTDRSQSGRG